MTAKHTIGDIAQLAGVSKATVSRVLNHKPDVDPETRERILRIVSEQGYIPSISASNLAGGRSRLIGVVVPSFAWPFIPDIMRGVSEVVEKTQYELVLYNINDTVQEDHRRDIINHILVSKLTAGILAILPGNAVPDIIRLHRSGFPVVMVNDQDRPHGVAWVGTDNFGGAYAAVRHLLSLGHRRIAHIQGPMQHLCSQERYQGFLQAMQEAGLTVDASLVVEGDFNETGGEITAHRLFSLPPEQRPTAIFAASDLTAYGVLEVAEEYHIAIPKDIALVGFDDISSAAHVRPALTTIRQPFYEMGKQSLELLLSMLDKPILPAHSSHRHSVLDETKQEESASVCIQLPTSLVVRSSSGPSLEPFSTAPLKTAL